MDARLRGSFRFHLKHGGYCMPPGRAVCALERARAELLLEDAIDEGVASVEWVDDQEPYETDEPDEVVRARFDSNEWTGPFGCVVRVADDSTELFGTFGGPSASLWGIVVGQWGTADPYCRVVAAELAGELEDDLRQALGDARDAALIPEYMCRAEV